MYSVLFAKYRVVIGRDAYLLYIFDSMCSASAAA